MSASINKILLEGILFKKGQINTSWKQRYFVLYENGKILYYENYNESQKKATDIKKQINLNAVTSYKIITQNTTSKKSDREFTFQLITISRTYTLSCQYAKQFTQWTRYIEKMIYGRIIYHGFMFKMGLKRKKWKKRWFILYDSKKLMYYENENKLSVAKGIINLREVLGLGYAQQSQYNSKYVIELKTSSRIWALKCLNDKELTLWFDHILTVMNSNTSNQANKANKADANGRTKAVSVHSVAHALKPSTTKLIKSKHPQSMFNISKQISLDFNINKSSTNILAMSDEETDDAYDDENINESNQSDKYRQIKIELSKAWQDIMKDIVINKKHTLVMDASSDFCINAMTDRNHMNHMIPTKPSEDFIASIPKMPYNYVWKGDIDEKSYDNIINIDNMDDNDDSDDIDVPDPDNMLFDLDLPSISYASMQNVLSPKKQKKINTTEKMKLFQNCSCISRILTILRAYWKWIGYKCEFELNNDDEGFAGMISILSDYSLCDLINDYYHIKRYHIESTKISKKTNEISHVIKTGVIDPQISTYFKENITKCNVSNCIAFKRNINERKHTELESHTYNYNTSYSQYLLNKETKLSINKQTVEIVTQQILDTIHCYLFHLPYCIRNSVGGQHKRNKFLTLIKEEEKKEEKEENEEIAMILTRQYSRYNSHFSETEGTSTCTCTAKYASIKVEVLNCENNISEREWIELYYKSELFLRGFESNKLKCKTDIVIDKKIMKKNDFFPIEYVLSILLYCNYDLLRNELLLSYRVVDKRDEFYHFGCILNIIINGFGVNIYDSDKINNISSMHSTNFYHCFSNPVLFKNLRCDFNGSPVSMTIIPSIVFTNMYIDKFKNGIIVEMDINSSSSNSFDPSIFSSFPYESERLFYGNISLSITNIIESDISSSTKSFCYHSNYLSAITLLRMIIGDCTMQKIYYINNIICDRLTLLISLEINYRRMITLNKNNNNNNKLVPEYIGKLFHSWCMNTKGVIVLKLNDILKLSQSRLQSYFLTKSKTTTTNLSLSYKILFQIFPFVTKILCYGIPFNEYLCKTFTDFLLSKDYTNNLKNISKVNECILQFDNEKELPKWDECLQIIEKYQNMLNENNVSWIIKPKIPQENSLETPKISFIKTDENHNQQ